MTVENSFTAVITFVLAMQVMKQLLPNLVAFAWQQACVIIPKKYRGLQWFSSDESLLNINKDGFCFEIFPVLTQGNARATMLQLALAYWLFSNVAVNDIQSGAQSLLSLFVFASVCPAMFIYACRVSKGNANPDVFIVAALNVASLIVAFKCSMLVVM